MLDTMNLWHALIFLWATLVGESETATFESAWSDRVIRCEGKLDWSPTRTASLSDLAPFPELGFFRGPDFEPETASIVWKGRDQQVLFVTRETGVPEKPELSVGPEPPDIFTPEFSAWFKATHECLAKPSRLYLLPQERFLEMPVTAYCGDNWDSPDSIGFAVYELGNALYIQVGWASPAHAVFRLIRVTADDLIEAVDSTC